MRILGFEITRAKQAKERVLPIPTSNWLDSMLQPSDYSTLVQMYHSWVYTCAQKNATAIAAVPFRLYTTKSKNQKILFEAKSISVQTKNYLKKNPGLTSYISKGVETVEVVDHPFLDLMKNVNQFNNQFDLKEQTELFLELTGNAYWYPVRNGLGVPVELWMIPSQYMTIIPDKEKYIKGYLYRRGADRIPYDEEEIIHFKFANPQNQFYGKSPASAIWGAYKFLGDIRDFENALLENRGMPEGGLETDQRVSDAEFERVKTDWKETHQGKLKVGKTAFLDKGIKYVKYGISPKDVTYPVGQKRAIEEIAAAFEIPMSKLTTEAVNLANATAGEIQYQRDTVVPRLRRMEEKLNEKLVPMFDDRLFVAFDDPVPTNRELELKESEGRLRNYVSTINEERAIIGKEPVSWGNLPFVPMNLMPYGSSVPEEQINEFCETVLRKIKENT
jgi:HK97 family phage portal protein